MDSFGVGSGPIFLDEVDCSETDSVLLQCNTFTPVGIHSCTHSQDVAILCEGTEFKKVSNVLACGTLIHVHIPTYIKQSKTYYFCLIVI